MSVKVMGLVWDHFPEHRSELLLALALADEADHDGGDILPTIDRLAARTRQTDRNVRRQLRTLEVAGWLVCTHRSNGGRNQPSRYRVSASWLANPEGFVFADKPGQNVRVTEPKPGHLDVTVSVNETRTNPAGNPDNNPDTIASGAVNPVNLKTLKPSSDFSLVPSSASGDEIDLKLAKWIFAKLQVLNPQQREPKWKRWSQDLRLLRKADGRSHREIAELFAWANADAFWQSNVESPGSLRRHWAKLELKRSASRSVAAAAKSSPSRFQVPDDPRVGAAADNRCAFIDGGGQRCGRAGAGSCGTHALAPWFCSIAEHRDQVEARASSRSTSTT